MIAFVVLASAALFAFAGKPMTVQVTLRGKKYDVRDVSTVRELQGKVESLSGLSTSKQSVLFDGKKLRSDEELEECGVSDGSLINIVPAKKKSTSGGGGASGSVTSVEPTSVGDASEQSPPRNAMDSLLKQAGLDEAKLKDFMDSLPGGGSGGAGGGSMPGLAESMNMMKEMANNPMFQEYMRDPEKLEQSRQMILNNPMMKQVMKEIPGFDDILNDKDKWRQSMIAAADMYQNMSPEMMDAMMTGLAGGLGEGLDKETKSPVTSALDELSEGDD